MKLELTPVDVDQFRSILAREAGLRFDDEQLPLLSRLLATRVDRTKANDIAGYLAHVATRDAELSELARTLTVSETYFFRNGDQFRALEHLLHEHATSGFRRLRVLSAGSSTGEEAYSIAMTIRETIGRLSGWQISILGVDINPDVIDRAQSAHYTRWSLRETPDTIRDKYFETVQDRHTLVPSIRSMVRFERRNLLDHAADFWHEQIFDIVFCRNVLMYLTPSAATEVVARFARCLDDGGHLFLGHAENLRGLSQDFHLRHTHGTFYYGRRHARDERRPNSPATSMVPSTAEAVQAAVVATDTTWFDAIARSSRRIEQLSRDTSRELGPPTPPTPTPSLRAASDHSIANLTQAMDLMKQERFHEALGLLPSEQAPYSEPDTLLLRAMLLVCTGDLSGARSSCTQLLAIDELNASAHYVLAICCEQHGELQRSIEHCQTAVYLDAEFAMPHLQLGRLARRANDDVTGRRELGLAEGLLVRENTARIILFGGGFSRDTLVRLCRAERNACGEQP